MTTEFDRFRARRARVLQAIAARGVFGFDAAYPIEQIDAELPELLADAPALFYGIGSIPRSDEQAQRRLDAVRARARGHVTAPGMTLTIEPGRYIRPAPNVPERFEHIGIRIGDDVPVTPAGCAVLMHEAPKRPEDIAAPMRG